MIAPSELNLQKTISFWDRVGLTTSVICIIHCTLTPLLIFFLPVLGSWFESPWVHILLALIVFPVGIFALYSGYIMHRQLHILIVGLIAFVALGIGLATCHLSEELIFTMAGGVLLSYAHIMNLRECRTCHDSHS